MIINEELLYVGHRDPRLSASPLARVSVVKRIQNLDRAFVKRDPASGHSDLIKCCATRDSVQL